MDLSKYLFQLREYTCLQSGVFIDILNWCFKPPNWCFETPNWCVTQIRCLDDEECTVHVFVLCCTKQTELSGIFSLVCALDQWRTSALVWNIASSFIIISRHFLLFGWPPFISEEFLWKKGRYECIMYICIKVAHLFFKNNLSWQRKVGMLLAHSRSHSCDLTNRTVYHVRAYGI